MGSTAFGARTTREAFGNLIEQHVLAWAFQIKWTTERSLPVVIHFQIAIPSHLSHPNTSPYGKSFSISPSITPTCARTNLLP